MKNGGIEGMNHQVKKSIYTLFIFVSILLSLAVQMHCKAEGYQIVADDLLELKDAITVNSQQELIDLLLEVRANHQEQVIIYTNPNIVMVENEEKGRVDVNSKIYNNFHYGYVGGLTNAMDYDVFSGPSLENFYIWNGQFLERMLFYPDENHFGYGYYKIRFTYHENKEELELCDTKIRSVLEGTQGMTEYEKVKFVYEYLKRTLPKEKESDTGYPRNCNGIYGALFGDGTGYCCSTYALTIQRFMEIAGIPAYIIGGAYEYGEPCHAFNVMKISGKWYVTDYTTDTCLAGRKDFNCCSMHKVLVDKYMKNYKMAENTYGTEKVTSLKLKNKRNKRVQASWKKVNGADGYQVQIAKDRNFTLQKKTTTVKTTQFDRKKLKKGVVHYVRVRAYNKFYSKKVYGSWSKVKKIKVKK